MYSRQIRLVFISALLVATARADEPQTKIKTCNAPAAECERAIRSLASGRRFLGAAVEELNPGLRIAAIAPESPAQRGGLGEGDRIMIINGHQLVRSDKTELKRVVSEAARDNGWLHILVQRGGILKRVEVRLEPFSKAQIDKMVAQHMTEFHPQSATSTPQP